MAMAKVNNTAPVNKTFSSPTYEINTEALYRVNHVYMHPVLVCTIFFCPVTLVEMMTHMVGRYESVDCSTGMEWWNGILE